MSAPVLPVQQAGALERAVAALQAGHLVVIPTDTVYGIAARPQTLDRLEAQVYGSRERAPWPALPLLLHSARYMPLLARSNAAAELLAHHFWPGAVTLILPTAPDFPLGSLDITTVALRVPHYPPLHPLLAALEGYVIVGRAARSGYPSCITAQEAQEQLGEDVALILDGGPSPLGVTSTIVDCIEVPPRIVQRGVIPDQKILDVLRLGDRESGV
ncbi:MAG: L-threonylcarbamoyladenylate synthase [Anaerolineae bacterium]|nr:L-threonylcarbamoyladenylate synthase [Anaerolineae bacterium]